MLAPHEQRPITERAIRLSDHVIIIKKENKSY